jgi:hypothetical protein
MSERNNSGVWDVQGKVRVDVANTLSYYGLHVLTKKVLCGEESGMVSDHQTMPHVLLQELYELLSYYQRQVLEDVLLDHLRDLAYRRESQWEGRAAHQLLLLAGVVLAESKKREDAIEILWAMAQPKRVRSREIPNLHWRALQTLVELGHGGHPDFWKRQFDIGGEAYAHVVLAGLSLCGPWIAIEWVANHMENEQVVTALFRRLSWFVHKHHAWEVERILWQHGIYARLSEDDKAELHRLGNRLGLDVGRPESDVFSNWSEVEMREFASVMQLSPDAKPQDTVTWRQELERELRARAGGQRSLDEPIPDVEVILGIAETVFDRNLVVPEPYRSKLRDYGDGLVSRLTSLDDAWRLSEATGIIAYSQRDAQTELRLRIAGR